MVLTIVEPPTVAKLYFWALQVTFSDASGREFGGAHTGLQWNPRHARSTAVNWGGYGVTAEVSSILPGSSSPLRSTVNDVNTRDFPWLPGRPYRFVVFRVADGWAADVIDMQSGARARIRTLYAGGDRLTNMVVWSEIFADCVDPPTEVRWSGFSARTASGRVLSPSAVGLTFPDGGACPNNDSRVDADWLLQLTNTVRRSRDGQSLRLPGAG